MTILMRIIQFTLTSLFLFTSTFIKGQDQNIVDQNNPTIYAVIVGISNYEHIDDLSYAEKDAQIFSEYVRKVHRNSEVVSLFDSDATRKNIVYELARILDDLAPKDTVIFYFSGHGDCETRLVGEPGFLLCYDSPINNYLVSSIRLDELKSFIETYVDYEGVKAFLFIDSCRAGKATKEGNYGPGKTSASLMNLFQNQVLLLGCKPDQFSIEKSKYNHGLFTYFLLKGLTGEADIDKNSTIIIEELRRFLYDSVMNESDNSQTPIVVGDPQVVIADLINVDSLVQNAEENREFSRPKNRKAANIGVGSGSEPYPGIDSIGPTRASIGSMLRQAIQEGHLKQPIDSSVYSFIDTTILEGPSSWSGIGLNGMKVLLLEELLAKSTLFLTNYIAGEKESNSINDWQEAITSLQWGIQLIPESDLYYRRFYARKLFLEAYRIHYLSSTHTDDWEKSANTLELASTIEPYSAFIYNELGYAQFKLNNFSKAEEALLFASTIAPGWEVPQNLYYELLDSLNNISSLHTSVFQSLNDGNFTEITLELDFQEFEKSRRIDQYSDAVLVDQHNSYQVKIKASGRYRRRICDFPPIKLKFDKKYIDSDKLSTYEYTLNLFTHCNQDLENELLIKEKLVYDLYSIISSESYISQLLKVKYIDANSGREETHSGLVIENAHEMADRNKGLLCETDESYNIPYYQFAENSLEKLALFQYMIGNSDWGLKIPRNVKIIKHKYDGLYVPVPYDFDFSGIVNAEYARPDPNLGQTSVKERVFIWPYSQTPNMNQAIQYFQSKQSEISTLIMNYDALSPATRIETLNYINRFFDELENDPSFYAN